MAAIRLFSFVLVCLVVSVYARSTWFDIDHTDNVKRQTGRWDSTSCSRPEDTICKRRRQDWCKYEVVRKQCPRKCGVCAPFTGICPSSYVFGCCWDGSESFRIDKSDCPVCKDRSPNICQNDAVRRDCDLQGNSQLTRMLCPETCGACGDFGNREKLPPNHV